MTAHPDPADRRRRLIVAVQSCRGKVAGLGDDTVWRDFLEANAGGRSLSAMSPSQIGRVLDALHKAGAPRRPRPASRYADTTQMRMIRGLWLELADMGAVADRSEAALGKFVRRQTRQDFGRLDPRAAEQVIEALKAWKARLTDPTGETAAS